MKPQSIPRFPGSTVCPLHIAIQTEDLRLLYDSSDLGGRVGPGPSRALMHHFGKSWPLNSDEANWTKKNRWKWVKLWINLEQTWGMGMASGILWLSLAGWKGHHWVWFSDSKPPWKPGICYRLVVPRRFKKHVWSSFTFCIFFASWPHGYVLMRASANWIPTQDIIQSAPDVFAQCVIMINYI